MNRAGVRIAPELTCSNRDAYLLTLLEDWASQGRYRRYKRRKLAIAALRSNGWTLFQIAEAFGIHFGRVGHLLADLRHEVNAICAAPEKKG